MSANPKLWQLISPTLPVGAYAYSAGLETAVEWGWVADEAELASWSRGQLRHSLAALDIPVLARLMVAWARGDRDAVADWNRFLLACRETAELRQEDEHMGRALARVLRDLGETEARGWDAPGAVTWAGMFACAAARWDISPQTAAAGYLWAWLENQVAAGVKLIPLGQTAGQRVLLNVARHIDEAVEHGLALDDDDMGAGAPGVAIASSGHETQYTRLFRS